MTTRSTFKAASSRIKNSWNLRRGQEVGLEKLLRMKMERTKGERRKQDTTCRLKCIPEEVTELLERKQQ